MNSITITAQDKPLFNVKIDNVIVNAGKYKDYDKYDIGNYIIFIGRYRTNLKYDIQDKVTGEIAFTKDLSKTNAWILTPKLFANYDNSIKVLMIEVASETSWGQEIYLTKDNKVKYIGYLDYAVNIEKGISISEYCKMSEVKGKIIMTFDDVPMIYWPEGKKIINGKDLKFELDFNGIKRIK